MQTRPGPQESINAELLGVGIFVQADYYSHSVLR
jgi:hypothetical protein